MKCGGRVEERSEAGKLLVRARGGRGWLPADAYTGAFVGSGETDAPARFESWVCNFCHGRGVERGVVRAGAPPCAVCGGSGRREHSPFVLQGADPERVSSAETVLETAIERRDEAGSFHELEACLAYLKRKEEHRWRPVHQVHVAGLTTVDRLDERQARWRLEGLARLDELMPPEIRVPAYLLSLDREKRRHLRRSTGRWADRRARAARDQEIRDRYNEGRGATVPELAQAFGVSASTIHEAIHGGPA